MHAQKNKIFPYLYDIGITKHLCMMYLPGSSCLLAINLFNYHNNPEIDIILQLEN